MRIIDYIQVGSSPPNLRHIEREGWAAFLRDKVRPHFDWFGDARPRVIFHLPFPVDDEPPMELEAWTNAPTWAKSGFAVAMRALVDECEAFAYLGTASDHRATPHPFAPAMMRDPNQWDEFLRWAWRNVEPIHRAGMGVILDRSIDSWRGFVGVLAHHWRESGLPFGVEPAPVTMIEADDLPRGALVIAHDRFYGSRQVVRRAGHEYARIYNGQPGETLEATRRILRDTQDTACVPVADLIAAGVSSYEQLMESL